MLKRKQSSAWAQVKKGLEFGEFVDPTLPRKQPFFDAQNDPVLPRAKNALSKPLHLTGHLARKLPAAADHILWGHDLVGFGLRIRKSGYKCWIVQYRRRGKEVKTTLGSVADLKAGAARAMVSVILAEAAMNGLMKPPQRTPATPTFAQYAKIFWQDYARH